jgi:hypothetical protein
MRLMIFCVLGMGTAETAGAIRNVSLNKMSIVAISGKNVAENRKNVANISKNVAINKKNVADNKENVANG